MPALPPAAPPPPPPGSAPTPRVALLRAVNVGGLTLKMDRLRAVAEGLGWGQVRTHIASGNLLFSALGEDAALTADLERGLLAETGVSIPALVLSHAAFVARVAACPFAPDEGKHVHGLVLWGTATIDAARLEALRAPSEALAQTPGMVWLHTPDGFGRSKLAERLDRVVQGSLYTARNLNTLQALVEKGAAGLSPPSAPSESPGAC
jgi:uncharacterized protein (DUF1697 family)